MPIAAYDKKFLEVKSLIFGVVHVIIPLEILEVHFTDEIV